MISPVLALAAGLAMTLSTLGQHTILTIFHALTTSALWLMTNYNDSRQSNSLPLPFSIPLSLSLSSSFVHLPISCYFKAASTRALAFRGEQSTAHALNLKLISPITKFYFNIHDV